MNPGIVYVVDFSRVSDVFVESRSGVFDFDQRFEGESAADLALRRARELLAAEPEGVELYFSDDRPESYVYEAPGLAVSGVRITHYA